jgi:hypothetical protein
MVAFGRAESGHFQHLMGTFDIKTDFLPGNILWFGHG